MATLKVTGSVSSLSLRSSWTCQKINSTELIKKKRLVEVNKKKKETKTRTITMPNGSKQVIEYEVETPYTEYLEEEYTVPITQEEIKIVSGPTIGTGNVTFRYELPSGMNVHSARVVGSVSAGLGGASLLTANGNSFNGGSAAISLPSNAGTVSVAFKYKSGGKLFSDTNSHTGVATVSNISLEIEYGRGVASAPPPSSGGNSNNYFSSPPQSVCIIDQTNDAIYTFDGVTKVQHNLTTDIQEEPDKPKLYVNNAKNEPDKLTIDVLMSDVYTGGTDITIDGLMDASQQSALSKARNAIMQSETTRSQIFFYALHWLKEQRRRVTVITPQFVHVDMIIASVTVNHDDATPFGWEGQIAFQHAFAAKPKSTAKNNKVADGNSNRTESNVNLLIGHDNATDQTAKPVKG